ncbi:MAG: hypothetical protein M9946_09565 [Nocardioidaceae bacterium]|nr:hypothetical protein [Nocardioidaceae bacterium]
MKTITRMIAITFGTLAAIAISGCGSSADKESKSESPTSSESALPLTQTGPEGNWKRISIVKSFTDPTGKSSFFEGVKVGDKDRARVVYNACEGEPCKGTVKRDGELVANYAWDGKRVVLTYDTHAGASSPDTVWQCTTVDKEIIPMWEVVMESGPDFQNELTPELDAQGRITSMNGTVSYRWDFGKMTRAKSFDRAASICSGGEITKAAVLAAIGPPTVKEIAHEHTFTRVN